MDACCTYVCGRVHACMDECVCVCLCGQLHTPHGAHVDIEDNSQDSVFSLPPCVIQDGTQVISVSVDRSIS